MTAETLEYQAAVRTCHLLGQMLLQYDLPAMLTAINRCESIGPVVAPTLWLSNSEAMDKDNKLLVATMPLWKVMREMEKAEAGKAGGGWQYVGRCGW